MLISGELKGGRAAYRHRRRRGLAGCGVYQKGGGIRHSSARGEFE